MTLSIGLAGADGRMGRAIAAIVSDRNDCVLKARTEQGDNPATLFQATDVVIDFTAPQATANHARLAADKGVPLVVGTTGLDAAQQGIIDQASDRAAILQAANFSLGITLLSNLVETAARALPAEWDVEIVEMHHRHKADAPSGTAWALGAAAAQGRDIDIKAQAVTIRDGQSGPRSPGTIGFAALRGGSVPGDHSVLFAGEQEVLTLSHHAQDRAIFARGAVTAALWLAGKAPGAYDMRHVLGLLDG